MSEITSQISLSISDLEEQFNIITHNLANVSTVGYKRICSTFAKSLEIQQEGTEAEVSGEAELETMLDFSQGSIVQTTRPLDFALYGKGFFVIETLEGPLYTRNGMFQTNQNGQIVDSEGRIIAGQSGPVTVPVNIGLSQVNVSSDGTISAGGVNIGQFRLVDFGEDENKLVSVGASCFLMPDENIQPVTAENIVVKQGYQEVSNVQMVEELVNMIMVSRLYEANINIISAQEDASSSLMDVAMA
ncbi:MAG: flagellar hook-basal body protein [Planctomycetota bacterium]|jgi:flagellar basal body rod protein FlgG